jgi:hypothetical protein
MAPLPKRTMQRTPQAQDTHPVGKSTGSTVLHHFRSARQVAAASRLWTVPLLAAVQLAVCSGTCNRPIIGLLTVPNFLQFPGEQATTLPYTADCFVPAGYVKVIEAGGARAVPLPCTGDWDEFKTLVASGTVSPTPRRTSFLLA